jgi:protein-tyrosine phosphatase
MDQPAAPEPGPITGYVNFRDLGGHPTPHGRVRTGRVYRSDSLAHVDDTDVEHLVGERGIRTVVDLRGGVEVDAYPNDPMRDAGAVIHHVPLFDPAQPPPEDFDWHSTTLADLYRFILTNAGPQFVEVLQLIAEPANHPLVFHCAAGKDRTGLIAAMVLSLLEVDDDEIVDDYALTAAAIEHLVNRARDRAHAVGRAPNAKFMGADPETMRAVLAWMRAEQHGFERYVLAHGFTSGELDLLRAALVEPLS